MGRRNSFPIVLVFAGVSIKHISISLSSCIEHRDNRRRAPDLLICADEVENRVVLQRGRNDSASVHGVGETFCLEFPSVFASGR